MSKCAIAWCDHPQTHFENLCARHVDEWEKSQEKRRADSNYYKNKADFLERINASNSKPNGVHKGAWP